jgi:hypothetical protein
MYIVEAASASKGAEGESEVHIMLRKISIALVIAGLVLGSTAVSQARPNGGGRGHPGGGFSGRPAVQPHHGFAGRPGFAGHPGFVARPGFAAPRGFVARPGFVQHRHFHHGGRVFVGVAPFVVGGAIAYGAYGAPYYYDPYSYDPGYAYSAPTYSAPAPTTYYYCQSAGAYYPDVPSCPEGWVTVPAQ